MDITKIFIGMAMALGLHLLTLMLLVALLLVIPGGASLQWFLGIGALQWVYLLPLALFFYNRHKEFVLGMMMIAGLTVVLNILYFLALIYQ